MELVTLREFARRIDVSLTAIQKGIKTGRIVAAEHDEKGSIKSIDWTTQSVAWSANSKAPQRRPHNIAGGRPRKDGEPVAAPKTGPRPPGQTSAPRAPTGDNGTFGSLADIQRARELVKLQMDNLKLKEQQGELIPAAAVQTSGQALASAVISGMYGIPDRVADQLCGMNDANEIHKLLVVEIDKAIEQLRERYAG